MSKYYLLILFERVGCWVDFFFILIFFLFTEFKIIFIFTIILFFYWFLLFTHIFNIWFNNFTKVSFYILFFWYNSEYLIRYFTFLVLIKNKASTSFYNVSHKSSHISIRTCVYRFIIFISQTTKIFPTQQKYCQTVLHSKSCDEFHPFAISSVTKSCT